MFTFLEKRRTREGWRILKLSARKTGRKGGGKEGELLLSSSLTLEAACTQKTQLQQLRFSQERKIKQKAAHMYMLAPVCLPGINTRVPPTNKNKRVTCLALTHQTLFHFFIYGNKSCAVFLCCYDRLTCLCCTNYLRE